MDSSKTLFVDKYPKLTGHAGKNREKIMKKDQEQQVKGILILAYVKHIRANKDKDWSKHLDTEDLNLVRGCVLASSWYPFDSFIRMGNAVFKEIADSKLDKVREFGRLDIDNFLKIYRKILVPGDPAGSLIKFIDLIKIHMEADVDIKIIIIGPDFVRYKISAPPEIVEERLLEAFCYQIAGSAEGISIRVGADNVFTKTDQKDGEYETLIRWE